MPNLVEQTPRPGSAILSEANFHRSRDKIVIVSGSGKLLANTVVGKVTASGKYKPSTVAATDGSEVASAVIIHPVDATSADVAVAAITSDAEMIGPELVFAADVDTDPEKAAKVAQLLTSSRIKVRY